MAADKRTENDGVTFASDGQGTASALEHVHRLLGISVRNQEVTPVLLVFLEYTERDY